MNIQMPTKMIMGQKKLAILSIPAPTIIKFSTVQFSISAAPVPATMAFVSVDEFFRIKSFVFTIGKKAGRHNLTKSGSKFPIMECRLVKHITTTKVIIVSSFRSVIFRDNIITKYLKTLFKSSKSLRADNQSIVDTFEKMKPVACSMSDFLVESFLIDDGIVFASFTLGPNSLPSNIAVTDRAVVFVINAE